MKVIQLDPIDGIPGTLELREPPISAIRDKMGLMAEDTQSFLLEVLSVSLYADGASVPDVLDKIGLSELAELTPKITELLGFGGDEEDGEND